MPVEIGIEHASNASRLACHPAAASVPPPLTWPSLSCLSFAATYVNCAVSVDDNNTAKVIYRCNPGNK